MEEFIRKKSEELLKYKKGIFKIKHATEFIQKLTNKEDYTFIEKELTKCLINKSIKDDNIIKERQNYINKFIEELKAIKETEKKKVENINEKKNIINGEWMPKMRMTEENFPSLQNAELVRRKKQFVVLDRHYQNKLLPGIKDCFCMSTRHPLVVNCLECGRVHCLQEGDKVCINCGANLILKNDYLKQLQFDNSAKTAYNNKDKLLEFQKNFYSKLQIIDDFSDWYDVSNNTWLDQKSRDFAKKKDDEAVINEKSF